jgi:hypothetical protein
MPTFHKQGSLSDCLAVLVGGNAFVFACVLGEHLQDVQDAFARVLVIGGLEVRVIHNQLAIVVPGHIGHGVACDLAHEAGLLTIHHLHTEQNNPQLLIIIV